MKYLVTVQGPFEGGDPSVAEHAAISIGRFDLDSTADAAAEWVRAAVKRLARGDADPDADPDADAIHPDAPDVTVKDGAVHISDVPMGLWPDLSDWEDVTDAAA